MTETPNDQGQENITQESNIQILGNLSPNEKRQRTKMTLTNEDHRLLLNGLSDMQIQRPGGFFSVGAFQNIDIALLLGASVIVLGDKDKTVVNLNLEVLHAVENAKDHNDALAKITEIIEAQYKAEGVTTFHRQLSEAGDDNNARIVLSFATTEEGFLKLKDLISQGKVAVAQLDITAPETMHVVGDFFKQNGTSMDSAYLSNTISYEKYEPPTHHEHVRTVEALGQAGGNLQTLLIRSGHSTNPQVVTAITGSEAFATQTTSNEELNRQKHYGKQTTNLPEQIERAKSRNAKFAFEFFIQTLDEYASHTTSST